MTGTEGTRNVITGGLFLAPVIQGERITLHLPARITPALAGLPAAEPSFTGRTRDLQALLEVLAPTQTHTGRAAGEGEGAVVVTAVGGMGGIGKTTLAVQAAHIARGRGWFGGGVLFADMFGYDPVLRWDADRAVEHFLRALAVPGEHIPADSHGRLALYRSILDGYATAGRPILVLVDNVSGPDQAAPLLPIHPTCKAIVTSRERLARLGARLLDLDILDEAEAVALLQRAVAVARPGDERIAAHPEQARHLARLCGGLPLALHLAAALLAENPALQVAELVAQLLPADRRLDELRYGDETITAVFDLSYRRLSAEQRALFALLPLNPGPDISTDAVAALTGQDQASARRTLTELARTHLIEPAPGRQRWRMHDLIRLYAAQKIDSGDLSVERDQALSGLLGYYWDTAQQAARHLRPPTAATSPRFPDRDGALRWLDAELANLIAAVQHCATSTSYPHRILARDLPLTLAAYLNWRRHFTDWITLAAIALHTAEDLGDRHGEGRALNNLGPALRQVRRFEEAITAYEHAATIFRETGDRHGEGQALNNLGIALRQVRRFDEAITAHTKATQIYRETGDRHGEGMALDNLGPALRQVRRFDEAITAHTKATQIFQETGDRHGEGMALDNLGIAFQKVRRFDEAITAHTKATQIFQETGDRHGEGMALDNLGPALQKVRRFDEAITAHTKATQIFQETGDRHGEGMALHNLGIAFQKVRRFDEAITAHTKATQIFQETGDRHGEGIALHNLGLALRGKRRYIKAFKATYQARLILSSLQ
ncbi:ATP-binding protein [Spongiactinospora sp. 9N601]|uniref:ATP-binding protein n=1 Tax=Spongiactinospora sp. 9N601 TaxID=3375149 RepID=UPI00379C8EB6